uniref:Glycosyl hydrolase family 13 catalytic domain-containing protein n=2 Tax=Gasterosteus aculeatus aculeatus TaxID=481459 RepID=A0AAQ4QTJ1_GASAC|nr:solute carrier family 3 member 2a isoform X3 [Gasterosteus aculeatus aculeatus]XP_040037893.1 solute carrier family 3 member 2a isoform X3 [Gasterosteus aculeatus aculeatus]
MSKETEIDMKDVELNELDPEKQPMTADGQAAGGEKNGSVKQKVPEDEVTFTGLSKEELMKVAGTPGWVRTRWVLLVLFWLGWLGMLAGAIAIIVQAPRCKPIPEMNWWNEGPLYQISDVDAFAGGIAGVEAKLDEINKLKVKGLILGPLHTSQADKPPALNLQVIDPTYGNRKDLEAVLEKAHKKGISVVLDLTPNYRGASPWFNNDGVSDVMEKVMDAAEYWLNLKVDGIKVSDLTFATSSPEWSKLQSALRINSTENPRKRLLMGVVESVSADTVSQLVNDSGVDLVLSNLLGSKKGGVERIQAMDILHSQQMSLAWGLGAAQRQQLSEQATSPGLMRLYQLLLFTMPGTPVFTYGDEIGLQALVSYTTARTFRWLLQGVTALFPHQGDESPKMIWDVETEPAEGAAVNETSEAARTERVAMRKWFRSLSDLRGKERSLLHGDYYSLSSSSSSLSFLRVWDQSERYITAVNFGSSSETLTLKLAPTEGLELPETGTVKLSTDEEMVVDSRVPLDKITLKPGQAVLLQFPYTG